jgi:hypothetical protein
VDVDALDPEEQRGLLEDVERAEMSSSTARGSHPTPGADQFNYRVEISDSEGTRTLRIMEPVPPEVRGLINRLLRMAKAQRPSRRA